MEPHDLASAVARLPALTDPAFTQLDPFNHGGIFIGRFSGQTPWERHPRGDELVHVLDGEVELTVLTETAPVHVTLRGGSVFVVPQGLWHRQHARAPVTMLTATPTPTDTSTADDPRSA